MERKEEPRFPSADQPEDLIQLRQSAIHRQGVFATSAVQSGRRIVQYLGEKITAEESDRREELYSDRGVTYLFDMENGYAIDGGVNGNIAVYINHSCDPNCFIEIEGDEIWVVARRAIAPGEELTYDYWFDAADDEAAAIPCCCGATSCRGTINRPWDAGGGNDIAGVEGARTYPSAEEGPD
ncbi:MAG: SET domain-containing protein-lysine N-methyltransferase [Acidobacteriia bacterium]|nr:SET domain-containing protein-lysine N-methyltransferase [Terriglobia bacterium]